MVQDLRDIELVLKNLRKENNVAIDFLGKMKEDKSIGRISTGLISLDNILGGGLPDRGVVEIYGKPSAGKTTLTLWILAQAQKVGKTAYFLDVEQEFDIDWALKNGLDVENIVFSQPSSLEQALNIATGIIHSGNGGVLIIDSLAALTPQKVLDGKMDDETIGLKAKKLSQFLGMVCGIINETRTLVIFTNQWRDKIGYGASDSPGGWASKHHFNLRMKVEGGNKGDLITGGNGYPVATTSRVTTTKNKHAPPYRTAEFRINFSKGIDKEFDLVESALQIGVVEKSGAWFKYEDEKIQGKESFMEYLSSPEVFNVVDKEVREKLGLIPASEKERGIPQ